ncbi:MAG: ASKHA domain-containing protein [Thermodesulfobacteriota bacterium]
METFKVIFQPSGKRGEIQEGKTLLEASRDLGVGIESICGGKQSCGKCRVKVLEGKFSPFTEEEAKFIGESDKVLGFRLACSARVFGDSIIFVPEERSLQKQVVRKEIIERKIELKPAIKPYFIELSPPSFHDLLGDFERVQQALSRRYSFSDLRIDYPTLQKLSHVLRKGDWKATVLIWMEREIFEVRSGQRDDLFGLAVDIGTTTLAGYLCNIRSGRIVATQSMMNPQVVYGEDVMSRISFAMTHPEGLQLLHRSILDGLNHLIKLIIEKTNLSFEDIFELTVVGNTVMHHLFLGINPQYLGVSPFPPVLQRSMDIKARELGLNVHPSANIHILPIEAGFVGADNVGLILSLEPHWQDEMVLIIDIGTNGELVMGNRERLFSASCATGPALEGAHIEFGMRAAPGAIERVWISPDSFDVSYEVIGGLRPMGICGSGIIDVVAELYRVGIIDRSGQFLREIDCSRLRWRDGKPEFIIAWRDETSIGREITITQWDIRNVQLAKAALYAGAKLLMKRLGIERLDKVILAGAFGSLIDPRNAMTLGMFPDCDLNKVYAVGNAAGEGARIALLNREKREEADEIAKKVTYLELTIEPEFEKEFIEAMHIPHMKDPFPHLG